MAKYTAQIFDFEDNKMIESEIWAGSKEEARRLAQTVVGLVNAISNTRVEFIGMVEDEDESH